MKKFVSLMLIALLTLASAGILVSAFSKTGTPTEGAQKYVSSKMLAESNAAQTDTYRAYYTIRRELRKARGDGVRSVAEIRRPGHNVRVGHKSMLYESLAGADSDLFQSEDRSYISFSDLSSSTAKKSAATAAFYKSISVDQKGDHLNRADRSWLSGYQG